MHEIHLVKYPDESILIFFFCNESLQLGVFELCVK